MPLSLLIIVLFGVRADATWYRRQKAPIKQSDFPLPEVIYTVDRGLDAMTKHEMPPPNTILHSIHNLIAEVDDKIGLVAAIAHRRFANYPEVVNLLRRSFSIRSRAVPPRSEKEWPTDHYALLKLLLAGFRFDMGLYLYRHPLMSMTRLAAVMPFLENRDVRVAVNRFMEAGRSQEIMELLSITDFRDDLVNTSVGLHAALDAMHRDDALAFESLVWHRSSIKWINKKIGIVLDTLLHIAVRRGKLWAVARLCQVPSIDMRAANGDYETALDLVEPESDIFNVMMHWIEVRHRRSVECSLGVPPTDSLGRDALNAAMGDKKLIQAMFYNPVDRSGGQTPPSLQSPIVSTDSEPPRIRPYYAPDAGEIQRADEPLSKPWPTSDCQNPATERLEYSRPQIRVEKAAVVEPKYHVPNGYGATAYSHPDAGVAEPKYHVPNVYGATAYTHVEAGVAEPKYHVPNGYGAAAYSHVEKAEPATQRSSAGYSVAHGKGVSSTSSQISIVNESTAPAFSNSQSSIFSQSTLPYYDNRSNPPMSPTAGLVVRTTRPHLNDPNSGALPSLLAKRGTSNDIVVCDKVSSAVAECTPKSVDANRQRSQQPHSVQNPGSAGLNAQPQPEFHSPSAEELAPVPSGCQKTQRFLFSRMLLKLIAAMFEAGEITMAQKGTLKDFVVKQDPAILAAADLYEADRDLDEFKDTLIRLSICSRCP